MPELLATPTFLQSYGTYAPSKLWSHSAEPGCRALLGISLRTLLAPITRRVSPYVLGPPAGQTAARVGLSVVLGSGVKCKTPD